MKKKMLENNSEFNIPFRIAMPILFAFLFIGYVSSLLISSVLQSSLGINLSEIIQSGDMELIIHHRHTLRIFMFISNFFMFLFPGLLFLYFIYKKDFFKTHINSGLTSILAQQFPSFRNIAISSIAIIVALPTVAYTFILNKKIPLPHSLIEMEETTNTAISGILQTQSSWELLMNIIVICLIPALGEELIFRGLLQNRLSKFLNNPHIAIIITSIIFSAIHMQFQGFLPRMILGMVLGYMFYLTGNFWIAVIAHFINNAVQVIGFYISRINGLSSDLSETPEVSFWTFLPSFLLLTGLLFLLKKINQPNEISSSIFN